MEWRGAGGEATRRRSRAAPATPATPPPPPPMLGSRSPSDRC